MRSQLEQAVEGGGFLGGVEFLYFDFYHFLFLFIQRNSK